MSRLTRLENGIYIPNKEPLFIGEVMNKLGKLEDIEDKLGCPLEVKEKTLDSFYCPKFENDEELHTYYVYAFNNKELFIKLIYNQYDECYNETTTILLKEYGITWWLKGDKNEN